MFCRECGAKLPDGARFCYTCGQAAPVTGASSRKQGGSTTAEETYAFCRKCGTSLPAGSEFCLKCGQAANAGGGVSRPAAVCGQCKAGLPAGSGFCPHCGQVVRAIRGDTPVRKLEPAKHRIVIWFSAAVLLAFAVWAGMSDDPLALRFQSLVNRSHTQAITPASFVVKARSFSSYKLVVPAGATQVAVSGQFSVTGGADQEIEVSLMSADTFVSWQDGYSGNLYYSSGRVAQGPVEAALPANADTYYLVFNNKFSARAAKRLEANITLHYARWWPIFLRRSAAQSAAG